MWRDLELSYRRQRAASWPQRDLSDPYKHATVTPADYKPDPSEHDTEVLR